MWSFALIIAGAQLCVGLPQEQQQEHQEVDILKGAKVYCKVLATVTYPLTPGDDTVPTVKCDTKCVFTSKEKDQSYFIGYVYRHFERLEKEYGLMVEIRYNKGTSKGCNLVPAASNEEVFSAYVDSNSTQAPTIVPHEQHQQHQEVDILKGAKVNCKVTAIVTYPLKPGDGITVKCDTKCSFTSKEKDQSYFIGYVYRHFERLEKEFGLMVEIRYNKGTSKGCNLVPAASNEEVFSAYVDSNSPQAPTIVPLKTLPTKLSPKPTTLSPIAPPTAVPTKLPVQHDPKQTSKSPIKPSTTVPTKLPVKHDPKPTSQSPIKTPTAVPTKLPVKHDPKRTSKSPMASPTTVPTKLPIKEEPEPSTLSSIVPPTIMPTKLPIKHNPKSTTLLTIIPPTKEPTADNTHDDATLMTSSYEVPQIDTSSFFEISTPNLFEKYEATPPDSTTPLDAEYDWVIIGKAYFHISKVRGDWSEGQHYCEDIGATLASVRSQEEQDGLAELVGVNAWIGLHDMLKEGEHVWEDQSDLTYSNWEPGQPDNSYFWYFLWWDEEDCVEMSNKYGLRWNDEDCDKKNIYICRRDDELLE